MDREMDGDRDRDMDGNGYGTGAGTGTGTGTMGGTGTVGDPAKMYLKGLIRPKISFEGRDVPQKKGVYDTPQKYV